MSTVAFPYPELVKLKREGIPPALLARLRQEAEQSLDEPHRTVTTKTWPSCFCRRPPVSRRRAAGKRPRRFWMTQCSGA